jgi:peptidoglycan/LPS O-acetylase OafA/YrhL
MEKLVPSKPARRADLDWLRVVCIGILLVYHVGMFFVPWEWHVKNPELLPVLEVPMELLHVMRMPLLMLIAGAGTAFALGKRSLGGFALDRVKRLLWPLMFGILVVVPPQIYVERVAAGQFDGSYLEFWPSVLEGTGYPEGNTSWHHLWFVAYLFVYCMAALPLLAWLQGRAGRRFLAGFEAVMSTGWSLFLLVLPLVLIRIVLRDHPETHALFDDPKLLLSYGWFFLLGHLFARCPSLWGRIAEQRRRHLAIFAGLLALLLTQDELAFPFEYFTVWAMAWAGMLAALGFARVHIHRRSPWLVRAQELCYPFYIWHQTVIVVLGFGLLRWDPPLGPWPRLGLLLAASFLASWALTEVVARVRWLRPCFGLGILGRSS